jgi:hypothetical protein
MQPVERKKFKAPALQGQCSHQKLKTWVWSVFLGHLLLWPGKGSATPVTLYDVDFNEAPHVLGQAPAEDTGPSPRVGPSQVVPSNHTPIVMSSWNGLTDRPVAYPELAQLEFALEGSRGFGVSYPMYRMSLDVSIDASGIFSGDKLRIHFDTPRVRNIEFRSDLRIETRMNFQSNTIGSYTPNLPFHLDALIDLRHSEWRIWVNGNEIHHGDLDGTELRSMRIGFQGTKVHLISAAFDSILIEGIPEPSGFIMFVWGFVLLVATGHVCTGKANGSSDRRLVNKLLR